MNKMTAVEWLENQITTSKYFYKLIEDINSRSTIAQSDIFEQAKEMEKQQTEISDEEIFKEVNSLVFNLDQEECFIMGAKWYREQLKQKL